MTELASREAAPSAAILSGADYAALKEQARVIARSGLAPKAVNTPEKVLVIAMKGRELGIPAMQALSHIHVIEDRPTMSAELMVALVQRAGHKLRVIETSAESCTVEGVRADDPGHRPRVTFSMDDAKRAGVANKGPWKQYPQAMLRARAISALCRFCFADVLSGASLTPEELGAEVNAEGEVIESEVVETETAPTPARETHQEILDEIEGMIGEAPDWYFGTDPVEIVSYARKDIQRARATREKMRKMLEEGRPAEPEDSDAEDAGEAEDFDDLDDFGGTLDDETQRAIAETIE